MFTQPIRRVFEQKMATNGKEISGSAGNGGSSSKRFLALPRHSRAVTRFSAKVALSRTNALGLCIAPESEETEPLSADTQCHSPQFQLCDFA